MPWIAEFMHSVHNWRHGTQQIKQNLELSPTPLRIGVLGAAGINHSAIIDPILTHPGAVLVAIAARNKDRAEAQIAQYGLNAFKQRPLVKAYGSYEELLADPGIDAVYIPLPNALHCPWAIKALDAGKHVLLEKPIACNAAEVPLIADAAARANKVVLEAYHWRFHPATHRVKALIDSGRYGSVTGIRARMLLHRGALASDDIRFKYELGGGATMDFCYVVSACEYFSGGYSGVRVLEATPRLHKVDKKVDEAMEATFVLDPSEDSGRPPVTCRVHADTALAPFLGFIPRLWDILPSVTVELEKALIEFEPFVQPTYSHSIVVKEKGGDGRLTGKKTTETWFVAEPGELWDESVGKPWWTTYRWQLEAFVNAVRAQERGEERREPWVDLDESASVMRLVDSIYDKAGLPRRGL